MIYSVAGFGSDIYIIIQIFWGNMCKRCRKYNIIIVLFKITIYSIALGRK